MSAPASPRIPALVNDVEDVELTAAAYMDEPGHVVLSVSGLDPLGIVITAADARRLMYQLACAHTTALGLAHDAAEAAREYAHA